MKKQYNTNEIEYDSLMVCNFGVSMCQFCDIPYSQATSYHNQHHNDRQKVVFPSKSAQSTQENCFGTSPISSLVVICDGQDVVACLKRLSNDTPGLLEIGDPCCPHPDHEVLVFRVGPLSSCTIWRAAVGSPDIIRPSYPLLDYNDTVADSIAQGKSIIEEVSRCGSAWTGDGVGIKQGPVPTELHSHFCIGNVRLAQVSFRACDISSLKLYITLALYKQPLVLKEVVQLIADIYRRIQRLGQSESNLTDITLRLTSATTFFVVDDGLSVEVGHVCEHDDCYDQKGEGCQCEADEGGFVCDADGFVPEEKLNEFVFGVEWDFQVIIFLAIRFAINLILFCHFSIECSRQCMSNLQLRFQSHMQEEFTQRQVSQKGKMDGNIKVIIKLEPQTLQLSVPLQWEVNKLKCLLCSIMPKLELGMVRLDHDGEELPGMVTFAKILEMDRDQQCMARRQFVIQFTKKENDPMQFQQYYAKKMKSFLSTMRNSPFQPILNPKYSALQSQFMDLEDINEDNARQNFQSLFNLRTLLERNRNRDRGQPANNQPANQEAAGVENVEGVGVLGPRAAANGNIFQRGAFWIFKLLQILLLWQLVQLVYNHISTTHIFILIAIILAYFCIDHFQKAKNQGNQNVADGANGPNQGQRQEDNPQRPRQIAGQGQKQADNPSEEMQQQALRQVQAEIQKNGLPSWLLKSIKLICLSVQVVISFCMSLFPNWTIHLHNNMLQDKFHKIDRKLQQWQQPKEKEAKEPQEQALELSQEERGFAEEGEELAQEQREQE